MVIGRCVWWSDEQGFGVIVGETPPGEVWAHFSVVEGTGFRPLRADEPVEFDWEEPLGGQDGYQYRATRVVSIDERLCRVAAQSKVEILEGLAAALERLDDVNAIVRRSRDRASAVAALRAEFDWTEEQAQHVLDMPVARQTEAARQKLLADLEARRGEIDGHG